jgi:hypothetical protein
LVQPADRQLAGVKLTLLRMQDRPMRDSPRTPVARDRGEQKIAATNIAIRRYADEPRRRRGGRWVGRNLANRRQLLRVAPTVWRAPQNRARFVDCCDLLLIVRITEVYKRLTPAPVL